MNGAMKVRALNAAYRSFLIATCPCTTLPCALRHWVAGRHRNQEQGSTTKKAGQRPGKAGSGAQDYTNAMTSQFTRDQSVCVPE